ncbi:MAG: M20/M25/M40 family metallo-hydrolase [Candidatus Aminicenantales bacterium]
MTRTGTRHPTALACGLLVLAAGLVLSAAAPDDGRPVSLIRIAKGPALAARVLARLPIDVRQELATCLLAFADRAEIDLLRRSGVRFTVLDRNAARREFLVVGTGSPGALASLRAAGRAVAVEPGTAVFWTEIGNAAESVPAGLPRKAFPPRSLFRSIPTRSVTALPSVGVSVQDPFIESIVSLVSSSDLTAQVQTLQDFQTRYTSTTNCESAGEALFSSFTALGLDDVRFEPFTFSGSYSSRNVVAEKTGETYPDDIYIICAHYDSTSPSRLTLAPGADDNASGTAAVLEAARVLAPYPLDFTVRFIAFSAEEWGLYGSRAYASAARIAGERILGVINLDMIAYADALPEDLQIIVNPDSTWLGDLFLAAGSHYGLVGGTKIIDPSFVYSDHAPFWDNGYPALLAIEDSPLTNPYYHRTTDTLATLDLDFFTSATRASVGLLAELAQPIKEDYPRTPVGVLGSWIVYRSVFNALPAVHLAWTAQADAVGYNVYRTSSPHGEFAKANATPVTGTEFTDSSVALSGTYYYVITAVGPSGLESNRSRETAPGGTSVGSSLCLKTLTPLILRGLR